MAIVGATGALSVKCLIRLLEERDFPRTRGASPGERSFRGTEDPVSAARAIEVAGGPCPEAFEGVDIVFFAATGALSKELAPEAVARGAVVIDKSSTWRMEPFVPHWWCRR